MGQKNLLLKVNMFRNLQEHTRYIKALLRLVSKEFKTIYLLINSFDLCVFWNPTLLDYLVEICKEEEDSCRITLITSVDSISNSQLLDEQLIEDLNLIFFMIDTFEDYSKEREFSPPIFNIYNDI